MADATPLRFRLRRAQALAVVTRLIEAADSLFTGRKHLAGIIDPAFSSLGLLCRLYPVNPVNACDGRRVFPGSPGCGRRRKRFLQVIG